jgi:hypothetical protein
MGQFIKFGLCTKVSFPEKSKQRIERYYESFDKFIPESESWRRMDDIDIGYEYIVLFLNGKAYMECYNEFFDYIEKLLRIRHQHPQVGAIKLFLD